MKPIEIFQDIKNTFGDLWKYRERGNSLEIITPYATTSNSFVSVFFTIRGNEYIFSDGGWLESGEYGLSFEDHLCFQKLFDHFLDSFSVLQTTSKDGTNYYYTKTNNLIDVPSRLFDITLFIQGILNAAAVEFAEGKENLVKSRFGSRATNFLKENFDEEKLQINANLIPDNVELKFNAIYNDTKNTMVLINYVTGSTVNYFLNSIYRTNFMFEMADSTFQKDFIKNKITFLDDNADGFDYEKTANTLFHLEEHSGSEIVKWSENKKLFALLN